MIENSHTNLEHNITRSCTVPVPIYRLYKIRIIKNEPNDRYIPELHNLIKSINSPINICTICLTEIKKYPDMFTHLRRITIFVRCGLSVCFVVKMI